MIAVLDVMCITLKGSLPAIFAVQFNDMRIHILLVLLFTAFTAQSQVPFQVEVSPYRIQNFGGVQSFAPAHYNGHWYMFGGRLDGLHQRQPWASFDAAGHNDRLIVVDKQQDSARYVDISGLSTGLYDQLKSTNMEYYQKDSLLYLVGGYGISAAQGTHITFPALIVVNMAALDRYVFQQSGTLDACFGRLSGSDFAVTGGSLQYKGGVFYLIGGHRFDGRYNPMNGPSFTQQYTNAVRKFTLSGPSLNPQVAWQPEIKDAQLLHRRDYNVLAQLDAQGKLSFTAFSGVFKKTADLPYLSAVEIDTSSVREVPGFTQYFNHYHCAHLPLFDTASGAMHNLFFGGIAQYYVDQNGQRVQDNNVPFVNTIAVVSKDAQGNHRETRMDSSMPGLLGAGSVFYLDPQLPTREDGHIAALSLPLQDTLTLGYIVGGIRSTAPNIFNQNTGTQSSATQEVFKVRLLPGRTLGRGEATPNSMHLTIYPNPAQEEIRLDYGAQPHTPVQIQIHDQNGRLVHQFKGVTGAGAKHSLAIPTEKLPQGTYVISLSQAGKRHTQQFIRAPQTSKGPHHRHR